MKLSEQHTAACQRINIRRVDIAAIDAKICVAQIIGDD